MEQSLNKYSKMPVSKAVIQNALPAVAAMLMVLIYNLAVTFFIGQTHDAYQVATVSLATPVFLVFMSIGTIFGVGGTSVISRAYGERKKEYAKKICSFCMWSCIAIGILLTIGFLVFMDAVLIMVFHWDIVGCALATLFGEAVGAIYYLYYYLTGKSVLSINIKDFTLKDKVAGSVLSIGIPAALGSLLMSASQIIMNSQMAACGDMAVAGIGVAMKIVMITGMVSMGIGQGVQPLLGYCVGAKTWERFKKYMKFAFCFATILGVSLTMLCYVFTNQIVGVFLTDPNAFDYAVEFARILLSTGPVFGIFYVLTNALQAMGAAMPSLIINISRQGLIYIPALFLLNAILGVNGLVWAQPIVDVISLVVGIGMYSKVSRKMMKQEN